MDGETGRRPHHPVPEPVDTEFVWERDGEALYARKGLVEPVGDCGPRQPEWDLWDPRRWLRPVPEARGIARGSIQLEEQADGRVFGS